MRKFKDFFPKSKLRELRRRFKGKRPETARELVRRLGLLRTCERAFLKLHVDGALDDAVLLCSLYNVPQQRWMTEALAQRILGTRKKKRGRQADFLRDDTWFGMIQEKVDAGMPLDSCLPDRKMDHKTKTALGIKTAPGQTQAELAYCLIETALGQAQVELAHYYGKLVPIATLKTVYKRHKKRVKRGYASIYVPRISVGLPRS